MMIKDNKLLKRFLRYVQVPTASDENSDTVPTSACQFDLARMLVEEMKEIGILDSRVDDKCYVYGAIPATPGCENAPAMGFIAHMDTVSDFADKQVKPQLHPNYDGEALELGTSGRVLTPELFPRLRKLKGRTLITSDGTTILGADDKAGVAEILTAVEEILAEEIPHGKICIGFTPDEEVGAGADHFDVAGFGADYAFTCDGGPEGDIEFENFNAFSAKFHIKGVNVHPGEGKDVMVNAAVVATRINSMLPEKETPRDTSGYEGFFHLISMDGSCEAANLAYIVRDHDWSKMQERLALLQEIADTMNREYGEGTVELVIKESYRNMAEIIRDDYHLIDNAVKAVKMAGLEPVIVPIRGGTDGARLSFMGLPCPNLGTGGAGYHGPYEHITLEGMEACVKVIKNIIEIYARGAAEE